jgi:glycosyltransferase involved in cell wall biosynthesis
MHLVALIDGPDHVCCRYRLAAFRPYLEQASHSLTLCPLPRGWLSRWRLFRRLAGASVILQRYLLPGWQLAQLRRHARHLVFDLDDAVFLRDSYSPRGLHHARKLCRFAATVRACDAIVAGNGFLAESAARWISANHRPDIHVIPTCVEPDRYCPRSFHTTDGKTLVWIGSSSTLQGLQVIAPLLDGLGSAVPGLRLRVICDSFPTFAHLPVVPCPWNERTEAHDLAAGDIGISWIPDDLWSRGKCGLKVLQYMAAGLPVIANPVGVHAEIIAHGETGYLASSPEEWLEAIRRLTSDADLRRRLGEAGRWRLEEHYSVQAGAQRWLRVIDHLAGGRLADVA